MKKFLKGLVAAIFGGAVAGATSYSTTGGPVDLKRLGSAAGAGALTATIAYFMRSPLDEAKVAEGEKK